MYGVISREQSLSEVLEEQEDQEDHLPSDSDKLYKKPAFTVDHPTSTYISVEQALEYCGDNSTYSKRCLYLLSVMYMLNSFLTMGWPLYFGVNQVECKNSLGEFEPCQETKVCDLDPLPEMRFTGSNTIVKHYNLFCHLHSWETFASSMYFFGMIVSGTLIPLFSDLKGRKKAITGCGILTGISLLATSLSPNILILSGCFFINGFGFAGLEILSFVYSTEISGKRFRNHSMVALMLVWGLSQVLFGFIVTFISDWRHLLVGVISVPLLISSAISWWLLQETPRYLVSQSRFDVAFNSKRKLKLYSSAWQKSTEGRLSCFISQTKLTKKITTIFALKKKSWLSRPFTLLFKKWLKKYWAKIGRLKSMILSNIKKQAICRLI